MKAFLPPRCGGSPSKPLLVAIKPAYLLKLKQIATLTDASVEALVNQAVSDLLESE